MGRHTYKRKHRPFVKQPTQGRDVSSPSSVTPTSCLRRPSNKILPSGSVNYSTSLYQYLTNNVSQLHIDRRKKLRRIKKGIQKVVALCVVFSWIATIIGYFIVREEEASFAATYWREAMKGFVGLLSIIQTTLIVHYWKVYLVYLEALRGALHPRWTPVPELKKSPRALAKCTFECGLHLFVFLPDTSLQFCLRIFGTTSDLSLDELCYASLLLRNYHSVRLFFWLSDFSDLRTAFLTEIESIGSYGFVLRCFLTQYGLTLILVVYILMIVVPGLILYIFEHKLDSAPLNDIWNNFWVVSYTQFTIGYGEIHPETFLGQVFIIVSSIFGYFTLGLLNSISGNSMSLSLTQCTMYSELLYAKHKQSYSFQACVLIQRWWRLMLKRKSKTKNGVIIMTFYSQLQTYRSTLVDCQRVKDTRFERQISAFEASTQRQVRPLNEYLQPVLDAQALVQDVFRNEYRIKVQCKEIRAIASKLNTSRDKLTHVLIPMLMDDHASVRTGSTIKSLKSLKHGKTGQGRAKAKHMAFQNVIGRLVKSDTIFSSISASITSHQ